MLFGEAIAMAVASVKANKLRSVLTILGVVIGIASVIAVVAITGGLDRYMADKVLALGTKSFTIQKFPSVIVSFDQFPVSLFLVVPKGETLPVVLFNYMKFDLDGAIAAASMVSILLALSVVLVLERLIGLKAYVKL